MKLITIINPCYNEEDVLPELYQRLNEVTRSIEDYDFEYLFVNDGSEDKTLDLLKEYQKKIPVFVMLIYLVTLEKKSVC